MGLVFPRKSVIIGGNNIGAVYLREGENPHRWFRSVRGRDFMNEKDKRQRVQNVRKLAVMAMLVAVSVVLVYLGTTD